MPPKPWGGLCENSSSGAWLSPAPSSSPQRLELRDLWVGEVPGVRAGADRSGVSRPGPTGASGRMDRPLPNSMAIGRHHASSPGSGLDQAQRSPTGEGSWLKLSLLPVFGGLPGCLLTTDDIAPAGREKILFQFGLTAQLLQTPIAAVMGMAAPVKVTVSLEGPVSQAGLDQVLPWGSGAHRGSKGRSAPTF